MTLGCPWSLVTVKANPATRTDINLYFFLPYPFSSKRKTLLFLRQIVQVFEDGCEKPQYGMTLFLTFWK